MSKEFWEQCNQSEGSERIIPVPGCDDGKGLGHDRNLVSISVVVLARLGADISNAFLDSVSILHQRIDVYIVSGANSG